MSDVTKMIFSQVQKYRYSSHVKNITTVLFSLRVSENFSSLHCYLNICKCFLRLFERLLNKTIKCGFSFSKFENEEQFSAKVILI